ncbi:MAG: hypothetical protein R2827_02375 [Bdellovibrionales bacterium]
MKHNQLDKNLGTFEGIIIVLAALVATTSGFLLINDHYLNRFLNQSVRNQLPMGTIIDPVDDVRHRYKSSFIWYSVDDSTKIYEGDSIFTGANSKTDVNSIAGCLLTYIPTLCWC